MLLFKLFEALQPYATLVEEGGEMSGGFKLLLNKIIMSSVLWTAMTLCAQPPVKEMRAELAAGFDPIKGRLITAGDTIIFMDDAQPQFSFFAVRSQVEQVSVGQGQSVSVQFKQPIRDRDGERIRVELRMATEDREILKEWFERENSSEAAAAAPYSSQKTDSFPTYSVRRDKLIGGDDGRLIVKQDRLAFEAGRPDASREWLFSDIRELKQTGPYRLEIRPFSGEKYTFELQGGGGMATEDYRRIADNIARAKARR